MKTRKLFLLLFYAYIIYIFLKIFEASGVTGVYGLTYFQKILKCSNLIPFASLGNMHSLIITFVMYMPLSILSRESYDCFKQKKYFLLFIILFITLHEVIQIITLKGYFDINDIIIGSLGAFLAYCTIDFMDRFIPRKSKIQ